MSIIFYLIIKVVYILFDNGLHIRSRHQMRLIFVHGYILGPTPANNIKSQPFQRNLFKHLHSKIAVANVEQTDFSRRVARLVQRHRIHSESYNPTGPAVHDTFRFRSRRSGQYYLSFFVTIINLRASSIPNRRHFLPFVNQSRRIPLQNHRRIQFGELPVRKIVRGIADQKLAV